MASRNLAYSSLSSCPSSTFSQVSGLHPTCKARAAEEGFQGVASGCAPLRAFEWGIGTSSGFQARPATKKLCWLSALRQTGQRWLVFPREPSTWFALSSAADSLYALDSAMQLWLQLL